MCYVPSILGTKNTVKVTNMGHRLREITSRARWKPGTGSRKQGFAFFPSLYVTNNSFSATVNPNIIIFDTQSVSTRSLIRVKFLSLCRFRSLLRPQSSCLPTSFRRRKFCLVSHVAANTENQAKDKERRGRTLTACREA